MSATTLRGLYLAVAIAIAVTGCGSGSNSGSSSGSNSGSSDANAPTDGRDQAGDTSSGESADGKTGEQGDLLPPRVGLDFPGSDAVDTTMRFRWYLNPLPMYPATYVWRAYPRQQKGYYTTFFWGNDDNTGEIGALLWKDGKADSYYGAHPYPSGSDATTHNWEIAVEQRDFQNGAVVYKRWYTQVFRCWVDPETGEKHHEFYWDWPKTDDAHKVVRTSPASWGNGNPPAPTLTWGDAPWNPGREVWDGVLTGIQIYSGKLSLKDIAAEVDAPLSTPDGQAEIWYMNLAPTPGDISDKSGQENNPKWVGKERPGLWKASGG